MSEKNIGLASYGYRAMIGDCIRLIGKRSFVEAYAIGQSVMGRPIVALRCGRGPRRVHLNGAFHANEWITSALLMRYLEDWSSACVEDNDLNGQRACRLYEETSLWIVPMVNPDGVDLALYGLQQTHPHYRQLLDWNGGSDQFDQWKANARGVDLNDQFPAHWEEERERRGTAGPAPRDYPGPYPLSEPEAQAIANFTSLLQFDTAAALHTQGEEIYWNYRDYEPDNALELAERLGKASGYKPVKLTGSDAGYKDWFIQQYRKPAFTIEAGMGSNPLPVDHFDDIYRSLQPLLTELLVLHR
ncbi:M14 family metallocarboxypeptidase [Paenibacillus sp. NPDC058071]|uniref:M14 family metallopeptidase n=1 Tax=Paenibacillus sp. NPDC058071 TaxID=3346326 RepID=UPI0036DEA941